MITSSNNIVQKIIKINENKNFSLTIIFYENGCFITLSEEVNRIGSITISSSFKNKITSSKIIPNKFNSLFVESISQRISSMLNGICLISLYNKTVVDLDGMKIIMKEIIDTIEERIRYEER